MPDQSHELANFLRIANQTCDEALEVLAQPLRFLADVDQLYMDFIPGMTKLSPIVSGILILNAHASLRAAIREALTGQILPTFMGLRGSIESVLYANAIIINPVLTDIWLRRGRDEQARRACRNHFTIGNMFEYLTQAHSEVFANALRKQYDSTIDFGAHPNSDPLMRSTRIEETDDGQHRLEFAYIHGSGSSDVRQALVACAEVSLSVFLVALICFNQHPNAEQLNRRALGLLEQMPHFIDQLNPYR